MKRILPILLLFLILIAMLISCNEINSDTNKETNNQITNTNDTDKIADVSKSNTEKISGADAIQISLIHFYASHNAKPSLGDYYSACLLIDSETELSHFVMIYEKCIPDENGYEDLIDGGCFTYEISKTNGDILSIIPGE